MQQALSKAEPVGLKLLFAGDVRLTKAHTQGLFDEAVQAYADAHDVRCCNFEGAAYHENAVTHKHAGPAVMQGKTAPERILNSGFNLITLANNHIMDYGPAGLDAALAAFSDVRTIGAGTSEPLAYRPYIIEQNGVKAGFLAMSEHQYGTLDGSAAIGTAWACSPQTRNNIRLLRSECSHVVVICHAGLEDVSQPLHEWRALYHNFIDAGATAVVCHHPHVPQGYERYKHGVVFHSLGNLAWEPESEFVESTSLLASITLLPEGKFDFAVRPVTYASDRVSFDTSEQTRERLDAINRVLHDDAAYRLAVMRICRTFYEREAMQDFFTVTGSLPGDGWQQVKNAGKLILRKRALNEPLLKHMLENESYRWAVAAALSDRGAASTEC